MKLQLKSNLHKIKHKLNERDIFEQKDNFAWYEEEEEQSRNRDREKLSESTLIEKGRSQKFRKKNRRVRCLRPASNQIDRRERERVPDA